MMVILNNESLSAKEEFDIDILEQEEEVVAPQEEVAGAEKKAKKKKSVTFSDVVTVEYVERYDRRRTKTEWERSSTIAKFEIRLELNTYKSREMVVHEASRHNTRYHSLRF